MVLYKYLAKKGGFVLPTVHMCVDSFLSRKEVEKANEGLKRVLGDANQDKKLAIQFFPDCGAPSVLEDVMVSNTTFDFTSRSHFFHVNCVLIHRLGAFAMPPHVYGYVMNFCDNFASLAVSNFGHP